MRTTVLATVLMAIALSAQAETIQQRTTPCFACHGENGQSQTEITPSLGAQQRPYLLIQLYMFREKLRDFTPMNDAAKGLSDNDLRNISDLIGDQPKPQPPNDVGDRCDYSMPMRWCSSTIAIPVTIRIFPAATMSRALRINARITLLRRCANTRPAAATVMMGLWQKCSRLSQTSRLPISPTIWRACSDFDQY